MTLVSGSDIMDDMTNPFTAGDWILWQTDHTAKRGQVVRSEGPSIVVKWLGGEEQVFPLVWPYTHRSNDARMEVIERPEEASRIAKDEHHGVMTVRRAAAVLGTTPKRIRAMLREGKLQGTREGGKWKTVVGVNESAESV